MGKSRLMDHKSAVAGNPVASGNREDSPLRVTLQRVGPTRQIGVSL